MKICPYCAESIQDAAIVCRFCGQATPPPLPPPMPAGPQPITATQRSNRGVAAVLGFITLGALGLGMAMLGKPPSRGPDLSGAWYMCRHFVEQRLAAPSTATFPTFNEADVFDLTGGEIRAIGWVDSQNAYGAKLRSAFTCTVRPLGGAKWRLTSLVFAK